MAHDIFISYSSKDKIYADAICASLEKENMSCWIAPRNILPGENWGEAIIDAITESRVMVIIFSANANASPQVMREVERAVFKNIPIIPFRIQDVIPTKSMEYFLSSPHWLDAIDDDLEKHILELHDTVNRILQGGQVPTESEHVLKESSNEHADLEEKKPPSKASIKESEKDLRDHTISDIKMPPSKKRPYMAVVLIVVVLLLLVTAISSTMLVMDRLQKGNETANDNSESMDTADHSDAKEDTVTNEPETSEETGTISDSVITSHDEDVKETSEFDEEKLQLLPLNVASLILEGNVYDTYVTSDMWAGMISATEAYNFQAYLYETDYFSESEAIEDALYLGSQVIILYGESLVDYIGVYASVNPNVQFVLIDGYSTYQGSNLLQLDFDDDGGIFLAGYIASLESFTGSVGFIGLDPVADGPYYNLFENGATYYADVNVHYLDAYDALDTIVNEDIDVVYNMAGDYGNYLMDLSYDYGYFVMAYQNLYGYESFNFLTSLIRDYYYAVYEVIDAYKAYGMLSGTYTYTLENSMVYFPNYNLLETTEDAMYDMILDILDGFVTIED